MIRVLVADDHPLVREGLKHILSDHADIEVAGEASDGAETLRQARENDFDVILLDMFMPGKSGIELIKQIKNEYPNLPILVLSTHKEDIYAVRTLKAGASGYLCKDYAASTLIEAIRKVANDGQFISENVAELMLTDIQSLSADRSPHTLLSDREYEVFLLTAQGLGSKDIAEKLHLSIKTISTHKTRIKEKMRISNSSDIVRYALTHGLIPASTEGVS